MRTSRCLGSSPSVSAARPLGSATRVSQSRRCLAVAGLIVGFGLGFGTVVNAKPFEEYIEPTPTVAPLSSATWGVAGVIPRDISNGIESAMGAGVHPQWYYWDGEIIRANDGKYHMFMSTFDANTNFGTGWTNSDAYHAISQTNVLGPYVRQDYVYSNGGSSPHKGHNVSAVQLPDGTYAVIVSEIVPFQIYTSSSLDGPWKGCSPQSDIGASNISMFPRHDGRYQIVERHGTIAISDTLCGHYVKQHPTCSYTQSSDATDTIYPKRTSIPGVTNPTFAWQEDPHIWRSGGTYHIIYSGSGDRVGWHVYSPDGITGWKDNGYAWSGRDYQKIFCYEGTTTCTAWYKMERPGVVLEDGHPTHITWAVSDVDKDNQVLPGTNHGTKVIVVPFDGVAFDQDFGTGGGTDGGTSGGSGGLGAGGRTGAGGATSSTGGSSGAGGARPGGTSGGTSGGGATGGATSSSGSGASSSPSATGGNVGSGGRSSNGGSTSSGGVGAGGSSPESGGRASSGGVIASSGGSPSTSSPAGGQSSSGGHSSASDAANGCSCKLGSSRQSASLLSSLVLAGCGFLIGYRRKRR